MPRQPRYAKRRATEAHDAVLAGKSAHKALALALGISPTTLKLWLEQQPDFASAVADARAELNRQRAEAAPARAGRKSKYAPGMDETARLHAATGKTDEDIAHELGVSLTTLRNWRQSHPGLHQAIQEGRDCWAVTTVEQSLIKRAQGYEYEETTTETGDKGERIVTMQRHMPPDTRAAQFVLTNRAPERWKQKQEVEHKGEVGLSLPDAVRELFNNVMGDRLPTADVAGESSKSLLSPSASRQSLLTAAAHVAGRGGDQ